MEKFTAGTRLQPVDFDPFTGPVIVRTVPSTEPQREVFVAAQMGPEASCAYNESVSLQLSGPFDRSAMERTIALLVQRHDGLRSVMSADGLRVIVQDQMDVPFTSIDIAAMLKEERERKPERDRRMPTWARPST
jgi:hypothetical protein